MRATCREICPEVEATLPKETSGRDRFARGEVDQAGFIDFLAEKERHEALRGLGERLVPTQRAVFEGYYNEGKSLQQIADELGIRKGAAAQRLSEARKRLSVLAERLLEAREASPSEG